MADDSGAISHRTGPGRTAVVVAHPVHLLRLYGWILENKPVVYTLTNGAGTGPRGPAHTAGLVRALERVGATPGEIFERSDSEIYRALLEGDAEFFTGMMIRIAASFARHDVGLVVADAHEGCSAAHDLCRAITDGAAAIAGRELHRRIANFSCYQTEWWGAPVLHDETCTHIALDDQTFAQKLAAASQYPEWGAVIQEAISHQGADYFRIECLRPVVDCGVPVYSSRPFYEVSGERQVAQGRFSTVIRYKDHVRPVWRALRAGADLAEVH